MKLIFILLILFPGLAMAELPTALTDKVHKGSGVIDVLIDVLPNELQSYLSQGTMFLGVDVNEAADGIEDRSSTGVAIKDITLEIQTTQGFFSFNDFYTNTSALIVEQGAAAAEEFYTLFGTVGSNEISGGSSGFDLGGFDDVVELRNINIQGDILSASLSVNFLETASVGNNEEFFDFSNGFEEFAIISSGDADLLSNENFGVTETTSQQVSFALTVPSGTPEPMWFLLLITAALLVLRR